MPDINFTRRFDKNGNVVYLIGSNASSGNKLLANNFEKTFLSNIKINDIFGKVYGGNAIDFVGRSYSPDDLDSISALVSIAVDKTVESIITDPEAADKPNTEKLESAEIISIDITKESNTAVEIQVIPIERQSLANLIFLF